MLRTCEHILPALSSQRHTHPSLSLYLSLLFSTYLATYPFYFQTFHLYSARVIATSAT